MDSKIENNRFDLNILQSLRRIIRAVELHSRKLSTEHEITGPQLVCLLCISENEPMTGAEIARQVHLSPSTVVGILDRLKDKGLINRERDLQDRRLVNVTMSEKGKALVAQAPSPLQDTLADALMKLPELEQSTIALSLQRVVDLMEAQEIDAAPILETGKIEPLPDIKNLKKVK